MNQWIEELHLSVSGPREASSHGCLSPFLKTAGWWEPIRASEEVSGQWSRGASPGKGKMKGHSFRKGQHGHILLRPTLRKSVTTATVHPILMSIRKIIGANNSVLLKFIATNSITFLPPPPPIYTQLPLPKLAFTQILVIGKKCVHLAGSPRCSGHCLSQDSRAPGQGNL